MLRAGPSPAMADLTPSRYEAVAGLIERRGCVWQTLAVALKVHMIEKACGPPENIHSVGFVGAIAMNGF